MGQGGRRHGCRGHHRLCTGEATGASGPNGGGARLACRAAPGFLPTWPLPPVCPPSLQTELGDLIHAELPEVGSAIVAGEQFGVVESVKVRKRGGEASRRCGEAPRTTRVAAGNACV